MRSDGTIIEYDANKRLITYGEKKVSLSEQRDQLWCRLATSAHKVVNYGVLESVIDPRGDLADVRAMIRLLVFNVNAALRAAQIPAAIKTVRARGLMLDEDVKFTPEASVKTIGPDQLRLIGRLISSCRDPILAEEATQEFIDRK